MSMPTRQIGGHKAALHNPNVSREAKERSKHTLEELEHDPETQGIRQTYEDEQDKDETRVLAGHKATLKNPNVSQEAKERSEEILREHGEL